MIDILVKAGMKKRIAKYFVNVVKDEFDVMNNNVKVKNFRRS